MRLWRRASLFFEDEKNKRTFFLLLIIAVLCVVLPLLAVVFIKHGSLLFSAFGKVMILVLSNGLLMTALTVSFIWFLFIPVCLPFLTFIISRFYRYASLAVLSWRHRSEMRLGRFPFASLFGISEKEDIKITTPGEVLYIHFIDIIYRRERIFTLKSSSEYCISHLTPQRFRMRTGRTAAAAAMRADGNDAVGNVERDCVYAIPEWKNEPGAVHILLLHRKPFEARYVKGSTTEKLFSGESVHGVTYYNMIRFCEKIKGIK